MGGVVGVMLVLLRFVEVLLVRWVNFLGLMVCFSFLL